MRRIKTKFAWLPKSVWFSSVSPENYDNQGSWRVIWLSFYYIIERKGLYKWRYDIGDYGRKCDIQNAYNRI